MTMLEQLSTLISGSKFSDLPAAAVASAKLGILDTIGVALAAQDALAATLLLDILPRNSGVSKVWGHQSRLSAYDASIVNATAAHALDFDDCNNVYGGHPSVHLVAALLALADELDCSGRDVLLAYVVGFETQCKIGRCDGFQQYSRGWHPTTTIGVFGAAAACARLLRLDSEKTAVALAIACSLASGVKANFGTMAKPFQVGHCARNGVVAARLAASGYSANTAALEHEQGYFQVFNGPGNFRPVDFAALWGNPYEVADPGIVFKQYPCCGSTHPAIDAVARVRDRLPFASAEILRIDCAIHELCLRHTNRPNPVSASDAKFSLQYCVARAILDGTVGLGDFDTARIHQAAVRALMARTQVRPYTSAEFAPDNLLGAVIDIELLDGTRLHAKVTEPVGASPGNAIPAIALVRKFMSCASLAYGAETSTTLHSRIDTLDQLERTRSLTDLL